MQQAAILEAQCPTYLAAVGERASAISYLYALPSSPWRLLRVTKALLQLDGDCIQADRTQLIDLFWVEKQRLLSYSTIRRVLLSLVVLQKI
jgi:hypothetical protein